MSTSAPSFRRMRQAGVSLVEVIIFIVIVGVAITGMVRVLGNMVQYSSDPMLQKQALAIAESLLEEVMLQPFTVCDPEAYDMVTTNCGQAEAMGKDTIGGNEQSRYSIDHPFNNVNDYHDFKMDTTGIYAINDNTTPVAGLELYKASISISEVGSAALGTTINPDEVLRIDVEVKMPTYNAATRPDDRVILTGYRYRYAPDAMP